MFKTEDFRKNTKKIDFLIISMTSFSDISGRVIIKINKKNVKWRPAQNQNSNIKEVHNVQENYQH